jgi:D-alanine-D-alanine ligase
MVSNIPHKDSLRIVVLAGGDSAEREVSLESGACVSEALRQRGIVYFSLTLRSWLCMKFRLRPMSSIPCCTAPVEKTGRCKRDLDRLGIPWLGSSAESSALTFDKVATRKVLVNAGLPVAPGFAFQHNGSRESSRLASCRIGYPVV